MKLIAFHFHAQHQHKEHLFFCSVPHRVITSSGSGVSEEQIVVRRGEPAVDVAHVEQVEISASGHHAGAASVSDGGNGGALVVVVVILLVML
jgi:hypothetical protein